MREGTTTLVRREDYLAPAYWIRTADLTFDLDAAKTIVSSKLAIERNSALPVQPLRLHGEDLNLLRVLVDGQSVSFRHEDGMLVIDAPAADAFTLEIRNTISPEKNTQLSGLYASGSGLFTQCEAEGFRRITYFLDRPDVMAVYTVTLRGDKKKHPVLLSNGNLVDQGALDGGKHFAKWHDPFPKPSYLFAVVAADLVAREQWVRTRSGKEHLLQVYVTRGDLDKTEHAMNSLIASIVWDEARFKLPLDLERFMIVAVPDFNMGAMENKGLNLFNTKYVLASPATATDTDFDGIESVVAHEYFHNWTGNRVTCRDWFQLSLKEGLTVFRDQEFSMDMAGSPSARAVCRIGDVRALRERQFPEDAGPMAHPVRPDAYQAIDNFYTATVYEKGAEVVRMMNTLVGRAGFAAGMSLYFERHDGQAVTCDDFAQAMADANPGSALAQHLGSFKRWYAQAGTPRLNARGSWNAEAATYTLTLRQQLPDTPGQSGKQPQLVPVALGLLTREGQALPLQLQGEDAPQGTERVLVLTEAEQSFTFTGIGAEVVPSLLRNFSAPVVLDDGLTDADLLVLLAHDSDAFNRWEAGQRLALNRIKAALGHGEAVQLDAPFIEAMRSLLREPGLQDRRAAFDRGSWLARHATAPLPGERVVSLFCYRHAPVAELIGLLLQTARQPHESQPTLLLVTPGIAAELVNAALPAPLQAGQTQVLGRLRLHALPHLPQAEFDSLLWSCDVNFVRGEDSFVRAQWAGVPLVWHIYPQDDGVHADKLEAFWQRYTAQADPSTAAAIRRCWRWWNGLGESCPTSLDADWADLAQAWSRQLQTQPDLTTQLLAFVQAKRNG